MLGAAGFALFHGYLARVTGEERHEARAIHHLDRAVERVGPEMGISLAGGVAGVGFAAQHLSSLLEIEDSDPDAVLEEALLSVLDSSQPEPELLYGLAGLAVYAVERLARPEAASCLERVVVLLGESAERTSDGATWFTPPDAMPARHLEQASDGYYNLGVAHGVPGVIPAVAAAAAAGVANETARALLDDAVRWVLAQRLNGDGGSCFPYWVAAGRAPTPARSAWCYGDPGIAAALLATSRAVGVEEWEREALAIARCAAERPEQETGVGDAALCHGAAGLGHIFNRIHQATGDALTREAAIAWFDRTLRMRSSTAGVAGYEAVLGREADSPRADDPGVLTGAAGIGLALLAATSDLEPGWDRLLGISIRSPLP